MTSTKPSPTNTKRSSRAKFPVLISYYYMRQAKPEIVEWWTTHPGVELLIDSGGFSALNAGEEIDLDEYIEWCSRWKSKLFGYFALDKLGDPKGSAHYLRKMHDAGLKPLPIHVRGDDERRMDELFEASDWVGLGGFRRPHRGWCAPNYVEQKMAWAKGRNVHWLGYTKSKMLTAFRPFSCDSSNATIGGQWGILMLYMGGGRTKQMRFHRGDRSKVNAPGETGWKDHPITPAMQQALDHCGYTVAQFRDSRYWRDSRHPRNQPRMLYELGGYSFVRLVRDIRRFLGTRYFMAVAPTSHTTTAIARHLSLTAPHESHKREVPEWMTK